MANSAVQARVTILDTTTRSQDQDDHMVTLQPCDGHSCAEPQHAPIGHSHKITRPRRSHGQDIATDGHSHTDKHNPLSYQNTTTPHRYHNDSIPLFHSHSLHSPQSLLIPQSLLAQSTVTPYSQSLLAQSPSPTIRVSSTQDTIISQYHHAAL